MAQVRRREIRKRGFFGWVFLILFLAFNAFMALLLFYLVGVSPAVRDASTLAAQGGPGAAGSALGAGLAVGAVLVVWALGSVITGLLALVTRGSKRIVEEEIS